MGQPVPFEGKIVRIEPDGFGIVEFAPSVGANTHGLFSTTTSESLPALRTLKAGMTVKGIAETNEADLAKIKVLKLPQAAG